jgi:hypothetical protein
MRPMLLMFQSYDPVDLSARRARTAELLPPPLITSLPKPSNV